MANAASLSQMASATDPVMSCSASPASKRSRSAAMRRSDRLEPIAWRSWSASAGLNPATSMAICISCSWNSGTPKVLASEFSSSGCR